MSTFILHKSTFFLHAKIVHDDVDIYIYILVSGMNTKESAGDKSGGDSQIEKKKIRR